MPKLTADHSPTAASDRARSPFQALRRWLLALAATTLLVVLCVVFVDRPVAQFAEAHTRNTRLFDYLLDFFRIIPAMVPLALLTLFITGGLALSGRRHPEWLKTPLLCSWSLVWSLAATLVFKHLFGRTGADPEYIAEGKYEFSFMHGGPIFGGPGHDSFPSGTMAVAGAIVGVLWAAYPRLRGLWAAILLVIAVALILANFHFVGDVIGGTYLGLLIAVLTLQLQRQTEHC